MHASLTERPPQEPAEGLDGSGTGQTEAPGTLRWVLAASHSPFPMSSSVHTGQQIRHAAYLALLLSDHVALHPGCLQDCNRTLWL